MNEPTAAPSQKVTAATAAGAAAILTVFVLDRLGVDVGTEGAAAIATLFSFLGGYLKREN